MSWSRYIVYFLFGGFGVLLICAGLVELFKALRFIAGATSAAGTVVAHATERTTISDKDLRSLATTFYHPIVEFRDSKGILHRVRSSTGASQPQFAEGATMRVVFDAENPERAEIATFGRLWGWAVFLLGGGALFLLVGIALWVFNVKAG